MAMTLIVLAATMGNKYGGLKQLEGIGPNGETILDFSVYDAVRVGFDKIVFVISRHFEQEFKKLVSGKYEHVVDVEYVYQDVETIPEEKRNPKRTALYGSVRAVLMGEELIDAPFGVINAVNFYQRESFELLYNNLVALKDAGYHSFNVCYRLKNVLAESGGVTRGICEVDENGYLISVTDRTGVERISGNPMYPNEVHKWVALDDNSLVSMNMWGFRPDIFNEMQVAFDKFIDENGMDLKAHYSIPAFMNKRIREGVRVKVIETPARWMGLVSHDDKIQVVLRINDMIRKGILLSCFEPIKNDRIISLMKKRILVTGGTGYIGSHTVVELQQSGYDVVIVDNLSNSNADVVDNIEKVTGIRPAFEKLDCLDYEGMDKLFTKYAGIEGIIHFAASKAVGESCQKPLLYYRNNLVSLINLLELMPKHNVKGIIFSSSCTVYGQPDTLPVTEAAPIKKAESPYGNTKQINEEIIRDTVASGSPVHAIMLRYFNPIGAHPSALIGELPNGVPQNLLPYVTQTAMGIREQLSVFGDDYDTPDGSCIRDYIYVVDLAKAHVIAMDRILNDKQKESVEVFNIGTGRGLSVLELLNKFEAATGVKVNYKIVGRRQGDIVKVWADPTFANEELGWQAKATIEETLKSAWNWQVKLRERGIQ